MLVAALGTVACLALVVVGLIHSPALLMVAFVLATKAAVDARVEEMAAARWGVSTAIGSVLAATMLGCYLWGSLPRRPVPPSLDHLDVVFDLLGRFLFFWVVLLVFGMGLLGAHIFFRVTRREVRGGAVRYVSLLTTMVLAALSLVGVVRSATRPSVERYLGDLMAGSKAPFPPHACSRFLKPRTPPEETRRAVDDIVVVYHCATYEDCHLGVFSGDPPPGAAARVDLPFMIPTCSDFEVTRLSPDLVLVRAAWQESRAYDSPVVRDALFRRRGDRWVISSNEDLVAGKASPPCSWVTCGVVGLALAIAAWRRRSQVLRRLRSTEHAEQTKSPFPDVVSSTDGEIIRWEAWALAISCLAAAPLAAAAMAGLVL